MYPEQHRFAMQLAQLSRSWRAELDRRLADLGLSQARWLVLLHLARGYAYKQIAVRLEISPRTVESHVGAVLRKLQLSSRHEVSHWAARRGILDDAEPLV